MVLERGVGIVPVIYLRRFAPLHSGTGEPRVSRPAAEVLSDAEAKERGDWRKRVRVERTIDTARRQSPVLKTGRVTGPPSLPQGLARPLRQPSPKHVQLTSCRSVARSA